MVGSGDRVCTKGEGVCKHPAKSWLAKAQFWGAPFEKTAEEVKGDDGVKWLRQWGGCAFTNMRQRRWGLGQNLKLSICGLISDMPCEMAVWSNGRRWWVRVDGMEVPGGLRIRQREAGGAGLGQNPKLSYVARFQTCRVKWWRRAMAGGGGCSWMTWRCRRVYAFANARQGGLGQNPKPSVCGLILDVLCETVVWGDARKWWVWVDENGDSGGAVR